MSGLMTPAKAEQIAGQLGRAAIEGVGEVSLTRGELAVVVEPQHLQAAATRLRDEFAFEMLVDISGVDYMSYGEDEWQTEGASAGGFSRGVSAKTAGRLSFGDEVQAFDDSQPRFAGVYHLLSISNNARLRLKVYAADNEFPVLPTLTGIWQSANWSEREAFDLFGIHFEGHPDLRRLLTDYGFVGHPFRKDFPLIGNVEMRYDPQKKRVVYEPVTIEPRVLVPRVIRSSTGVVTPDDANLPKDADTGEGSA